MFGSIVHDKTVPEVSTFLFSKGIDQGFSAVDIQVIHNEMNRLCCGVLICDMFHHLGKLSGRTVSGCYSEVASSFWFNNAKGICCSASFVFVVRPLRFSGLNWPSRAHIGMQGYRLFVQTNHWFSHLVRLLIDRQYILHPFDVIPVQFCYAPHFFPATVSSRGFRAIPGLFLCPREEPICV